MQLGFPELFHFLTAEFILSNGNYAWNDNGGLSFDCFILGGFGNYLIPLMVGARDMVFPYVNMISFWMFFVAVVVLMASFFVPGGPTGSGWTLYPPQAILEGTPGSGAGILLMLVSLSLFVIGFTMGGLNYVITILQARTRGMSLMRMPLTIWGIFTATVLALLAFPALFVSAIMMTLDKVLGTSFFMPTIIKAGEVFHMTEEAQFFFSIYFGFWTPRSLHSSITRVWYSLRFNISSCKKKYFWLQNDGMGNSRHRSSKLFCLGTPYVRKRNEPLVRVFLCHNYFNHSGANRLKVYNWILTLWRGNIRLNTVMLFCLGFIVTFVNGGITGIFLGNVAVDVPLSDTYFVIAHFHMVMGIAPLMVIFGAIYHWFPLVTGRFLDETLGKWHFWVTFLGAYSIYFPMHYLGFIGVPRRYFEMYDSPYMTSAVGMNEFITISAFIVGAAQFIFFYNVVKSIRLGKSAGKNPWKANSLEWLTPNVPPAHGNWGDKLPVVHRWAYDYSVPGAKDDFIPQTTPPSEVIEAEVEKT